MSSLKEIVDLDTYPIDNPSHPKTIALVEKCHRELEEVGCSVVSQFVRSESVARMKVEANASLDKIFWTNKTHNAYFQSIEKEDRSLPENHAKRLFEERTSGYINTDVLPENSDLAVFYNAPEVMHFLNASIKTEHFYQWADPIAKHPYSVMQTGHYFPWHFDANKFTVSILVQNSEEGGIFEFVPDVRTVNDENYDEVSRIVQGDHSRVHKLPLQEGDLQLFKGHFTIHRVTKVSGNTTRIIALPSYVTDPNHVNLPLKSIELYGKALPIHYEREHIPRDTLTE